MTRRQNYLAWLPLVGLCESRQTDLYYNMVVGCTALSNLTGKEIAHVVAAMFSQEQYGYEKRMAEEIEEEKIDRVNSLKK